jgi:hypothetical protein
MEIMVLYYMWSLLKSYIRIFYIEMESIKIIGQFRGDAA